ncbi:MAG: hypothetical protein M0T80_07035, partial [Actinomycetota bacterium]|nr:hypothetical protein [Actinomycetota bacterium]
MASEAELVGAVETLPACLADGGVASGVLVVRGEVADAGVETDGVAVAPMRSSWRLDGLPRPHRTCRPRS